MTATEKQLKERWQTKDGQALLTKILQALKKPDENPSVLLKDFSYTDEVGNNIDLRYAPLHCQNLQKSNLWRARLEGADLRKANLSGAMLCHTKFNDADIRGTKFENIELGESHWGGDFSQSELQGQVDFTNVRFNEKTSFLRTDFTRNNWSTNPLLLRHIQDQQWLYTWRNNCWFNKYCLYPIWWISCDCGRSVIRWAFWSMVMAIIFGAIFRNNADCFNLANGATLAEAHWFTPFYYSIVTFTTLGFGDVVPNINNGMIQLYVTVEVILGYIMLGGLISILATKLARRS